MAILRRTKKAKVRSTSGVKLVDRKKMKVLGLKETLDRMTKANGIT